MEVGGWFGSGKRTPAPVLSHKHRPVHPHPRTRCNDPSNPPLSRGHPSTPDYRWGADISGLWRGSVDNRGLWTTWHRTALPEGFQGRKRRSVWGGAGGQPAAACQRSASCLPWGWTYARGLAKPPRRKPVFDRVSRSEERRV